MIGKVILAIVSVLSLLFYFLYFTQYYQWRDCFNAQGRCYDSETNIVYLEQSGPIWLLLAVLSSGISLLILWRLSHRNRHF